MSMDAQQIVDKWIPAFDGYVDGCLSGKIVVGEKIKRAIVRHQTDLAADIPYEFCKLRAARACEWISRLTISGGTMDGQRMTVFPWQVFFLCLLFGWIRKDSGLRRFRNAYLSVGRGNGKSPIAAAIGLKILGYDEPNAENSCEVYSIATKRDQARIVWGDARDFVSRSKGLQKRIRAWKHSLTIEDRGSRFLMLASDGSSLDGLRPNCVLMDEIHAFKAQHRETLEKIRTAMTKKPQSLWLYTTTAGNEESDVWLEVVREMHAILDPENEYDNYETLVVIYDVDESDDILDETCWPKANPMLEHGIVDIDQIRELARKVDLVPTIRADIERYHCNRKTFATAKPITQSSWARGDVEVDWDSLTGSPVFVGFDWGMRDDLSAMALVFPLGGEDDDDGNFVGKYAIKAQCWMPEKGKRSPHSHPLSQFVDNGSLTVTPGDTTDVNAMSSQLLQWDKQYTIEKLVADQSYAREFLTRAHNDYGIDVYPFPQSHAKYNEPVNEFLKALHEGRIHHGGCKLLEWAACNLSLRANAAGHQMPDKKRSQDKIDPIVCVIMALSEAMFSERTSGGFYSSGGIYSF